MWVVPSRLQRELHSADWKCRPWSVVMTLDTPNLAIQPCRKLLVTVSAQVSATGKTSGHRVNLSTQVTASLHLWESGNGPMRSRWISSNIWERGSNFPRGDRVCLVTFAYWQLLHSLAQRRTSRLIPGQTTLDMTNFCEALTPGCDKLWKWQKIE